MPIERRDRNSGAKLFIPTVDERMTRQKQVELNNKLKEVREMKEELEELLSKLKEK